MKILLDMDQTITAFDERVKRILGKTLKEFPRSKDGWEALGAYKDNMFLLIDPLPDAELLVTTVYELAEKHGYTVGVLTAIPLHNRVPLAVDHKKAWLKKYFPRLLDDFNVGPYAVDKQNHCSTGDVLIDDSELNIPQWVAKGGYGILHKDAKSSIFKLKQHLESL